MSEKVKYRSSLCRSTWSMASLSGFRRARPSTTSKAKLNLSGSLNRMLFREPSAPSSTSMNFSQIRGGWAASSGEAGRSSFFSRAGRGWASSSPPPRTMA